MNDKALATTNASILEQVVMTGDLSKLTPEQRVSYYLKVCESTGLNPMTRPFDYITLNGKLTLYARKDASQPLYQYIISNNRIVSNWGIDIYTNQVYTKTKNGGVMKAILVDFDEEMIPVMDKLAKEDGISRNEFIRIACNFLVNKRIVGISHIPTPEGTAGVPIVVVDEKG